MRQFLFGLVVGGGIATTTMMWLYGGPTPARERPPAARVEAAAAPRVADEAPAERAAPATPASADDRGARDAADLRVQRDALRQEITALKGRLADQAATLRHYTGDPIEFPEGLDPLYREEALMQRFTAALKAIGADGEVTEIDCSEFPCVVYGKVRGEDGTGLDRLRKAEPLAAYGEDWGNTSIWGGKAIVDGKPTENAVFGVALMPKGSVDEGVLQKRLRFRHQTYWEAVKSELPDAPPE